MNPLYYALLALVVIGLGILFLYWWKNRFKYYIIKVITKEKRFLRFEIIGTNKKGKRKIVKNGDGTYVFQYSKETFLASVKAADLDNVCFKAKWFAKQVVHNLLSRRKPAASTPSKPAKTLPPKTRKPPKKDGQE